MDTPQKIGRYEILEELGHGAMGAVYRAKDPAMDRIVALKTIISTALASEQGSEFRERFFREARAAGQLTHPGIVPVFDIGEHDGSPFMVMEYVNGWTLANAASKGVRLDLNRMCEIGQNIAEALGYAHLHGIVHRDIKPANILLTSRESHGAERPKITDFGIAKLTESEATMTGKMLGTPAFMPPEQFTGAPLDGRADIFSLGVVLYWLATGEQPFPGEGLTAILYKVVHTDPIPPRKLNPALPARFESIVMKCMEKDPAARYQTAEEAGARTGGVANRQVGDAGPYRRSSDCRNLDTGLGQRRRRHARRAHSSDRAAGRNSGGYASANRDCTGANGAAKEPLPGDCSRSGCACGLCRMVRDTDAAEDSGAACSAIRERDSGNSGIACRPGANGRAGWSSSVASGARSGCDKDAEAESGQEGCCSGLYLSGLRRKSRGKGAPGAAEDCIDPIADCPASRVGSRVRPHDSGSEAERQAEGRCKGRAGRTSVCARDGRKDILPRRRRS